MSVVVAVRIKPELAEQLDEAVASATSAGRKSSRSRVIRAILTQALRERRR